MAHMMLDNFVQQGTKQVNQPLPIEGNEKHEYWYEHNDTRYLIRVLDNGATYHRPDSYYYPSPYGWSRGFPK